MKKLSDLLFTMGWITLFFFHIYTTIFTYKAAGVLASIIAFFTPVLSTLFWFFATWYKSGFNNNYIYELTISIGWFLFFIVTGFILLFLAKEKKHNS